MTLLTESFMLNCRTMYLAGLKPFGFDNLEDANYAKLQTIAGRLTLRQLYEFFQENQYYSNLRAAIFILDEFKPVLEEKLVGLNDKTSIVDEYMEILKRHSEDFNALQQQNYDVWIKEIKTYYYPHLK